MKCGWVIANMADAALTWVALSVKGAIEINPFFSRMDIVANLTAVATVLVFLKGVALTLRTRVTDFTLKARTADFHLVSLLDVFKRLKRG